MDWAVNAETREAFRPLAFHSIHTLVRRRVLRNFDPSGFYLGPGRTVPVAGGVTIWLP